MFLGVFAEDCDYASDGSSYCLALRDNPLTDLVELPEGYEELKYCNLLCGVIRGALEQVSLRVKVEEVSSVLSGLKEVTLLKVTLIETIKDDVAALED